MSLFVRLNKIREARRETQDIQAAYNYVTNPDFSYFVKIRKIIGSLDRKLDAIPVNQWRAFGDAKLGDEPCPFLKGILEESHYQKLSAIARDYHQSEKDLWQVCNLLACQVHEVAHCAEVYEREPSAQNRITFANANLRLGFFSENATYVKASFFARILRKKGQDMDAIDQELSVLYPDLKKQGLYVQLEDDTRDLFTDMKAEMKNGLLTPNLIIAEMNARGINLSNLYDRAERIADKEGLALSDTADLLTSLRDSSVNDAVCLAFVPHKKDFKKFSSTLKTLGIEKRFNVLASATWQSAGEVGL